MRFDYKPPFMPSGNLPSKRTLSIVGSTLVGLFLVLSLIPSKDQEAPTITVDIPPLMEEREIRAPSSTSTEPSISEPEWKAYKIQSGDTLSSIFSKIGIANKELHRILNASADSKHLNNIRPGQIIRYLVEESGLKALTLVINHSKTVHVENTQEGYDVKINHIDLDTQLAYTADRITDSLFLSAQRAGLTDKLIMQMVEIFGWDIDFALDIRENDQFKVLYEEKLRDGQKVETGNILAIEFTNRGQTHQAVRFTDLKGNSGYYSPEGYGMQKAFLRTPVNFTRISSHFTLGRKHPILHRIRAHKGVDYAAPHGTPIKSVGNGKVSFIGNKGGYGKVIELQHGPKYSTLYAHLSRFSKGLRKGSSVKQGQIIGYVGSTGLATGPHLHYEFRIDGRHRNPLTVKLPRSNPIDKASKPAFKQEAERLLHALDTFSTKTHQQG